MKGQDHEKEEKIFHQEGQASESTSEIKEQGSESISEAKGKEDQSQDQSQRRSDQAASEAASEEKRSDKGSKTDGTMFESMNSIIARYSNLKLGKAIIGRLKDGKHIQSVRKLKSEIRVMATTLKSKFSGKKSSK